MSVDPVGPSWSVAIQSRQTERDEMSAAVELQAVSSGSWQVCDRRVPAKRAGYLLAFVVRRNGVFDVLQLTNDFRWRGFATMGEAIANVVETNAAVSAARHRGELLWIR
jgi:hypothetical protein